MNAPPTDLLLAQQYPGVNENIRFPIRIHAPSTSSLLIACLNWHSGDVDQRSIYHDHPADDAAAKSILINCYGTQKKLIASLHAPGGRLHDDCTGDADDGGGGQHDDDGHDLETVPDDRVNASDAFFTASEEAACRKVLYRFAMSRLEIVNVTSLQDLRGVLYLLKHETPPCDDGVLEVEATQPGHVELAPASQPATRQGDASRTRRRPLLAIAGFDSLHRVAGEYSAQGLGRTLASLREITTRELLVHDGGTSTEARLLSSANKLPKQAPMQDKMISIDAIYTKSGFPSSWTPDGAGLRCGVWRSMTRQGVASAYKVTWNQDPSGECREIRLERL